MSATIDTIKEDLNVEDELICFRFLESDEYNNPQLQEIFAEYNDEIPRPNLSRIAVGELQDGRIIGFLSNSFNPTVVMWIDEQYRGSGLWVKLVEMVMPLADRANEAGVRTYVIATRPETEEMCERLGLRKINHPVYVKDI